MKPQLSNRIYQKSLTVVKNTRELNVSYSDTVKVRDYRENKVSWIKGTYYTYLHVSVCGMLWKRHVNQICKCDAMS